MVYFLGTVVGLLSSRRTRNERLPTWKCHEEPVERIKSRGRYLGSIGSRGVRIFNPFFGASNESAAPLSSSSFPFQSAWKAENPQPRSWDPWSTGLDLSRASEPWSDPAKVSCIVWPQKKSTHSYTDRYSQGVLSFPLFLFYALCESCESGSFSVRDRCESLTSVLLSSRA